MRPSDSDLLDELWGQVPATVGSARADVFSELGHALMHEGRFDEAVAVLDEELDLRLALDDLSAAGEAAHNAAVVLHQAGRLHDAIVRHRRALELHAQALRSDHVASCRFHLGELLHQAGCDDEAVGELLIAIDELQTEGQLDELALCRLSLIRTYGSSGRFAAASRLLDVTVDAACVALPVDEVAGAHLLATHVLTDAGRLGQAKRSLIRARVIFDALGNDWQLAECDVELAGLDVVDDPEGVLARVLELRMLARQEGAALRVARCDIIQGRAQLALGRPLEAVPLFEAAATVARSCAEPMGAAVADVLRAKALAASGQQARALKVVSRVLPRLTRMRLAAPAREARLLLAQLLLAAGDGDGARREAQRARRLARRAGHRADLATADALLTAAA